MRISRAISKYLVFLAFIGTSSTFAQPDADTLWQSVTSADGSVATARHEAHAVSANGKIYLMGGRGMRPVEVYDPIANSWRNLGNAPLEIHHFQPVVIGQKIYAIAAFTCCFPDEPSIAEIYVFDTLTEQWAIEGAMPANRVRGAAASVVWQGDIYVLGGNTMGHNGGAVAWLDRFDPQTGAWQALADAPEARDHFAAVVIDGQLVAAGGRATGPPNRFANTIAATHIYDFSTGVWRIGADIPNPRAGTVAVAAGDELIIAGGESSTRSASFAETEAYNLNTDQWRSLQPMLTARHSGGAAVLDSTWHVIAGNLTRGGGQETSAHETLDLSVEQDQDSDGLSDSEEIEIHNTDPSRSDTDGDGAYDGDEVDAGSDPLIIDSDTDGLTDGEELNTHNTNPLSADTDGDTLSDFSEVGAGTDPLKVDTDDDGLTDQNDSEPLVPVEAEQVVQPTDPTISAQQVSTGGGAGLWIMLLMGVRFLSRTSRRRVNVSTKIRELLHIEDNV